MMSPRFRLLVVVCVFFLSGAAAAFALVDTGMNLAKWSGYLLFLGIGLYLFSAPLLGQKTYLGGAIVTPTDHLVLRVFTSAIGASAIALAIYFFFA